MPPRKRRALFFLGVVGIVLMVYTASTRDLSMMLLALLFSLGVGAYIFSTGIETRSRRKILTGGIVLATGLVGLGLIITIAGMMLVSAVILPASETVITVLGSAVQAIIAYVCLVMGW